MKKWILSGLLILFGAAFLISAGFLVKYFGESRRQQKQFNNLAELVEKVQTEPTHTQPEEIGNQQAVPPEPVSPYVRVIHPETGASVEILRQYAEVYRMNPDMVGWMEIPGTDLNYPVMQTPNRIDYYLRRNFNKEYSEHGCIYVQEEADVFTPSDNMTIYGHRMNDGSMFAVLARYTKKDFYDANPIIRFDTIREEHEYQIIAVFRTTASIGEGFNYHLFIDAANEESFNRYVETCRKLSFYDTGHSAVYGDKLITLSTCEYSQTNGRLVVVAKRIRE